MTTHPIAHVTDKGQPGKRYRTAFILSIFLGYFGVDRFYLGKIGTGVVKLLTFGGFGLWYIIDVYLVAHGKLLDEKEQPLIGAGDPDGTIRLLSVVYLWVQVAAFVLSTLYMIFVVLATITSLLTHGFGTAPAGDSRTRNATNPPMVAVDNQKYIAVQLAADYTDPNKWASYPSTQQGTDEISVMAQMNPNASGLYYEAFPNGCAPTGADSECDEFMITLADGVDDSFIVTQDTVFDTYLELSSQYRCGAVWPREFIVKDTTCKQ